MRCTSPRSLSPPAMSRLAMSPYQDGHAGSGQIQEISTGSSCVHRRSSSRFPIGYCSVYSSKTGGPDEDSDDEMRDIRSRVLVSCSGVCILVRQPGSACFEGHDHHDGSARTGRPVPRSRGAASRGKGRESLQGSFRILPCGRNHKTHQRFGYQSGDLAACQWLERQVSGRR